MIADSNEQANHWLQIVGPTDQWILERLARRLAAKLPYAEFVPWSPRPNPATRIVYYVNYALFNEPSGGLDIGFFTHLDEKQQFLERARAMDWCICMSRIYADWLRGNRVDHVSHIPMGFDYHKYRPRLVLGVVGRLDHPRKGKHLVERLRRLPFVEIFTTEGRMSEKDLPELYQGIDYVLIPATVEGGPMSLLEGLAMGKPIIAPEGVGMVPEFGATEHIQRYRAGDGEALEQVVQRCYQEKLQRNYLVKDRTWDRWAESHHELFVRLVQQRGIEVPQPAVGFRFGMLGELDVPLDQDVEPVEMLINQAALHLYFARYGAARRILEQGTKEYPFIRKLLDTIPDERTGSDYRYVTA
jgi:hypothetical protein